MTIDEWPIKNLAHNFFFYLCFSFLCLKPFHRIMQILPQIVQEMRTKMQIQSRPTIINPFISVLEILASWSTVLLLISGHRVPLNQVQMREVLCSPAVQISSFTTRSAWSSAHNWAPESPWLLWPRSSRSICASMPGRSSLGTYQSESFFLSFSLFIVKV